MEGLNEPVLRAIVSGQRIRRWRVRCCPICDGSLDYVFDPAGNVYWDARCHCVPEGTPMRKASLMEVLETITRGTKEQVARRWRDFCNSRGKLERS